MSSRVAVLSRQADGRARDAAGARAGRPYGYCLLETFAHDIRFADGSLFVTLNAMAVIGMTEKGKKLNEGERGELAGKIAAESHAVIARYMKHGQFVIPLSTNIAIARA